MTKFPCPTAMNPALIADLKKATKDFDISKSITTIFSHSKAAISCLDRDSLGLRSSHKVMEVNRREFERSLDKAGKKPSRHNNSIN